MRLLGRLIMKKALYISLAAILVAPYLAYSSMQAIYPCDPDLVHVRQPSLFAAKWQKVAYSDNFSEYINPVKIEKNLDSTVEVITMRNYFKTQSDHEDNKNIVYKSQVSYETVDCYHQTVTVNKIYLIRDHFADGPLVDEPIEPMSTPIKVSEGSIGSSKIAKVCALANQDVEAPLNRSHYMSNI